MKNKRKNALDQLPILQSFMALIDFRSVFSLLKPLFSVGQLLASLCNTC